MTNNSPDLFTKISAWLPLRRLLIFLATVVASYLLLPLILTRYNEARLVRDARTAKTIELGDFTADFDSKVNRMRTLMFFYVDHNVRMKDVDLRDIKTELFRNFKDQYLADLDPHTWWWPQSFKREVAALNLLSPDEMSRLDTNMSEYGDSLKATVGALGPLWEFLDSPDYKLNPASQAKITSLRDTLDTKINNERSIRYAVAQRSSGLFVNSHFRTRWRDMVRFW